MPKNIKIKKKEKYLRRKTINSSKTIKEQFLLKAMLGGSSESSEN